MRRLALLAPFVLAACGIPGPVDEDAALEVVYDPSGVPAFAGQAVVIESCGQGGFCHARDFDETTSDDPHGVRLGAPAGLGFDLRLASTTNDANEEETARLSAHVDRVFGTRAEIWRQVSIGSMPPRGDARAEYLRLVRPVDRPDAWLRYDRVADDGVTFTPLPSLLSDDEVEVEAARQILRNWLASLSELGPPPVVERTQERVDREGNVIGRTVATCERDCVDATWPSLYERLIRPTCTLSRCHSASEGPPPRAPAAGLDMLAFQDTDALMEPPTLEILSTIHDRLVTNGVSEGDQCGPQGLPLIAAGDPEGSLLFLKVSPPLRDAMGRPIDFICGSPMPLSGNPLTEQRLCALRAWIECGACEDPTDAACLPCVEAARESCNIDPDAVDGCIATRPCPNRPPDLAP